MHSLTPTFLANVCFSLIITFLFGMSCSYLHPDVEVVAGGWWMLGAAGTGWVLLVFKTLLARPMYRKAYLQVLGKTMTLGVLVLIPATVLGIIMQELPIWLPIISVLVSSGWMLAQHAIWVKKAGLPPVFTWVWFLTLQITAIAWAWLLTNPILFA